MKTLIKKNLYYKNTFHGEIEAKSGSRFMGGTGVIAGGSPAGSPASGNSDGIEYLQIGTLGNTIDWGGELFQSTTFNVGVGGDGHRGILSVGGTPSLTSMEWVSFASKGTAADYGELSTTVSYAQGCSNGHRGVWYDGIAGPKANIYYVDFGSRGTAADFGGDRAAGYGAACAGNDVRAVWQGGHPSSNDIIDYVNIGVTGGNSTDFGECNLDEHYKVGCSNGYRGLYCGGGANEAMEYVTIGTAGVGIDFGELHAAMGQGNVVSDGSRGVICNGFGTEDPQIMDFVNIGVAQKAAFYGNTRRSAYTTANMSGD